MNEKNKDFKMQEEKSNTLMDIKRTIRKLHENNRNDVPQYLDTIKTKLYSIGQFIASAFKSATIFFTSSIRRSYSSL